MTAKAWIVAVLVGIAAGVGFKYMTDRSRWLFNLGTAVGSSGSSEVDVAPPKVGEPAGYNNG